ncbi:uncharacterized protein DUF3891 [Paenibacillus taihuensis]|uniref:Uncharacterized protein DUF3891 n=1 Tax=Paenibacillus taihuensis TaxID=1156355 RepID=A0A3D9S6Y5_9BACL|nr:DUF3891 family protein [Paenibacillus taihuensis]REE88940.1 uncharacterized protein DUF3891 [Paenibacillus taihuensis]
MIVRESENDFSMVTQHDHAILSRDIAGHFKDGYYIDLTFKNDILLAIREHDRGWIRLDETPIWNDRIHAPFSFMDYPLYGKLPLYRIGIDEVEEMSSYAALLCSLHYTSFKPIRNSAHPDCVAYMKHETNRQNEILKKLDLEAGCELVTQHLNMLQLCDDLSLYVCLNQPGATKEEEHPWYKEAFGTAIQNQAFRAKWINNVEIGLQPFPFIRDFKVSLRIKHVSRELRAQYGIGKAYMDTEFDVQEVTFADG